MPASKARTERGDFIFVVKVFGDPGYYPYISAEPRRITTSIIGKDAQIFFDLKTKDHEKAQEIADYLNKNIERVAFTLFENHPMFNMEPPTSE